MAAPLIGAAEVQSVTTKCAVPLAMQAPTLVVLPLVILKLPEAMDEPALVTL